MSTLTAKLIDMYDNVQYSSLQHQRFYQHSGYCNFGYWYSDTKDGKQAGDNLVDRLLGMIPTRSGSQLASGAILDVACGQGGTTHRLQAHYDSADITAINISDRQIERARERAPGCSFMRMNATELAFPDEHFDTVLCVEAAFHFETRARFLREAYRVLRPGGYLALSDILTRMKTIDRLLYRVGFDSLIPQENYETTASYHALLADIGFEQIQIVDVMPQTFNRFAKAFLRSCIRNLLDPRLWPEVAFDKIVVPALPAWIAWHKAWMSAYILVAARKPT